MSTAFGDPLYRPRTELPVDGARHVFGSVPATVLVTDTDPNTSPAQWMADREIDLVVTDEPDAAALRAALPEFLAHAATLVDRPSVAGLMLPSRDVERAHAARECGLWPTSVLAVADLRRAAPAVGIGGAATGTGTGVAVRDATPEDADTIAALWLEQAEYEARVGTLRTSPGIRAAIAADVPRLLTGSAAVLVAERDGSAVGAVIADRPAESGWASARLTLTPASYLQLASTSTAARGGGVGTALVEELHRRQVATGVRASVLHYSLFNPLSVPFWSRCGYRPLLTSFAAPLPGSA